MYENVVIGINGLSGDRDAVALAKELVAANGRLTLVNVRVVEMAPSKGSNGAYEAAETEHSHELLQSQREAYAKEADVVSIVAMSVGAGLHGVAENSGADLIVVGGCHRGPIGRVLAGDDARAAVHHAPCPVAVAPTGYGKREAQIRTIGVAYDGSAQSEVALAHAGLLATDRGAKLRVREVAEVHVYGAAGWASAAAMIEDPDALAAAARERIRPIPEAEIDVVMGPVLPELAELSEQVDLMVCGSRQQAAAKRILLGSTSDYLIRHSHCPLIVTPASDEKHVAAWRERRDAAAV